MSQMADKISEIVSNSVFGEDVLPAHERAVRVRDLFKPSGRFVPARGAIPVALAEDLRDDRESLDASPGQEIRVFGPHDRYQVSIWCDPTDNTICRVPSAP